MQTISRQALFEEVWIRPLSIIAPEFGISDVALRRICDRYNIPAPGRGYWAQVASGKTFPRPKLPPGRGPQFEIIQIVGAPQPSPEVKLVIERARAERSVIPEHTEGTAADQVMAPESVGASGDPHPIVRLTYQKLSAAAVKGNSIVQLAGKGLFPLAASPGQADRIGKLLTQLVTAMEAKGWTVNEGEKGLRLVPDGEPMEFEITEQTERFRHQPTEMEQAALRKHEEAQERAVRRGNWSSHLDRPAIPEWDYRPTGQLVLSLADGMRHQGMRRKFSDGKTQRLEHLVGPIMESLEIYAASEKAWRERCERERLAAIEEKKRREEMQRRSQLEEKRLEFLKHQMERHRRALEVEAFVADVEMKGEMEGVVATFLAWARDYAAALRADISPDALREKLEQLGLMNDEAAIDDWKAVDHPLEPASPQVERYQFAPQRQGAPWWYWK